MIPAKILSIFQFIDFLHTNKEGYVKTFIPLVKELEELSRIRYSLNPGSNYRDKQKYDQIQIQISIKSVPLQDGVSLPILKKLQELKIWLGDEVFTSIYNANIGSIYELREVFSEEDVNTVLHYKKKYIDFRKETNSYFLSLQLVFEALDSVLKVLFDFFKVSDENEFEHFEMKITKADTLDEVLKGFVENRGKNVSFSIPLENLYPRTQAEVQLKHNLNFIKNEFVMGNKVKVGDISNVSGPIVIGGNDIRISESFNGKQETLGKIEELISLIREEPSMREGERQSVITDFGKVKEEIKRRNPNKAKIFKWLSNTKVVLESLILPLDLADTLTWVYENLNFGNK